MKVICKDKTVDTDHFEKVQYQESVIGGSYGFPVEFIRKEPDKRLPSLMSLMKEEILRFRDIDSARMLVDAITKDLVSQADSFDVERWVTATQMETQIIRDKNESPCQHLF